MRRLSRRDILSALGAATVAPSISRAERKQIATERFTIERVEVFLKGLDPAHDGLKVAQLSDLHVGRGSPDGRVISAVRAVNDERPDLVVLTGDFVTSRFDPHERVPQLLGNLAQPAVAVLGNHDHWTDAKAVRLGLEGIGVSVLQNRNTTLKVRNVGFTVVGIDDATSRLADPEAAFKGAAKGSRLVLTHTPNCAARLPAWEDLLCLSGHTHGGQWDVPRLTEGVFKRAGQPWYRGHYRVRGNQLYVNRGLGFGKGTALPRLNSEPEVTVLTLRVGRPLAP